MTIRYIRTDVRNSTVELTDCISSLFATELISPSPVLYLISPWISDVGLISNRFGQFRALLPELDKPQLSLANILNILADKGTEVRIIHRPHQAQTDEFLMKLSTLVTHRSSPTLHEKGLVTRHFHVSGSMNFTYSGVNLNDEVIILDTDPSHVASALENAHNRWNQLA